MKTKTLRINFFILFIALMPFLGCKNGTNSTIPPEKYTADQSYSYNTSDVFKKSRAVYELLKADKFKEIEDILDDLLKRNLYSKNGRLVLNSIYLDVSIWKDIKAHLDKWCQQTHAKSYVYTFMGYFYIEEAWRIRGANYGYTVSDSNHQSFKEMLALALKNLEAAYKMNPHDPCAATQAIVVCTGLGLTETTMDMWFKRATKEDPAFSYPYDMKLLYLLPKWRGTWKKASEFAVKSYNDSPPESRIFLVKAKLLLEFVDSYLSNYTGDDYEQARREFMESNGILREIEVIYNRYIQEFPQSTTVRVKFSKLYSKIGSVETAIGYCNQGLLIDPGDHRLYVERAKNYEKMKSYDDALADYRKALDIFPEEDSAFQRIGVILYIKRNYQEALDAFNQAVDSDLKDELNYYLRAKTYTKLRKYDLAALDYLTATSLDPKFFEAYIKLGLIYNIMKKYNLEIESFTKAIDIKPTAFAFCRRGSAYFALRKYDNAIADSSEALKHDPRYADAFSLKSLALKKKGQFEEAIENSTQAIRIKPNNAMYYYERAELWEHIKNYRKACDDLNKAVHLNPQIDVFMKKLKEDEKMIK